MSALSVLAFEAFDTGSHRAVRESITRHSRHDWTWITRPGRAWKWRMRIGALELVESAWRQGRLDGTADVIFATSMCSLTDLIASLPPELRMTPSVLYMHENQAVYPAQPGRADKRDAHFALTNLVSVEAADLTIWNSAWNRESFRAGIMALLVHAPESELVRTWRDRSSSNPLPEGEGFGVIWPPVEPPPRALHNSEAAGKGIRVVWPHRWEHDKGPDELLDVARQWTSRLDLRWILLGEQFQRRPPSLERFLDEFAGHIEHAGYAADRTTYWSWLRKADWVLSTAAHEFFGIAVVEAMLVGCLPWLPDRLSYPELLPDDARGLHPATPPSDAEAVRDAVRVHLEPALAVNAVSRLDDAIESVVSIERPRLGR